MSPHWCWLHSQTIRPAKAAGKSQEHRLCRLLSEASHHHSHRSVLPKKEMHLAVFRLVSLTNSTECSRVSFFHHAANFRVRFFPVLRSALNSQGETEGRRDILSQEGKCLLVPVMQANLQSPARGLEGGQQGEKVLTNSRGGRTSWTPRPPAALPVRAPGPAPHTCSSEAPCHRDTWGPEAVVLRPVTPSYSTCCIPPLSTQSHALVSSFLAQSSKCNFNLPQS